MARTPINIRAMLLKSGKEKFLAHGFEKSSLRTYVRRPDLLQVHFIIIFPGKRTFSPLL